MATNKPLMSVKWTSHDGNEITLTNRGMVFVGLIRLDARAGLLEVYEYISANRINPQPEPEP